jgi:hypothetical protein
MAKNRDTPINEKRLEGLKKILVNEANNLTVTKPAFQLPANSYDEVFENCFLGD